MTAIVIDLAHQYGFRPQSSLNVIVVLFGQLRLDGIEQCSIEYRRLRTGEDFALIDHRANKEAVAEEV